MPERYLLSAKPAEISGDNLPDTSKKAVALTEKIRYAAAFFRISFFRRLFENVKYWVNLRGVQIEIWLTKKEKTHAKNEKNRYTFDTVIGFLLISA